MRSTTLRLLTATLAVVAAAVLAPLSDDAAYAQVASGPSRLPAAGGTGSGEQPAQYRTIPAQVFEVPGVGRVAVGSPSGKRVLLQHYDEASGTWGAPRVLFEKPGVTCGQLAGRASAGGVALILECDTPYYEDEAPVHSQALVSQDLVDWSRTQLPGEAYQDPAISPDGTEAAWLAGGHGEYVRWSADDGFASSEEVGYSYDSGGETLTVDDAGTVDVLGPDSVRVDGQSRCVVHVYQRTVAGDEDDYALPPAGQPGGVDPGCTEGALLNTDATTVVGDPYLGRESQYVLGRDTTADQWQLVRGRAVDAPGIEAYSNNLRRAIAPIFLAPPGGPIVAVGSPDRQHLTVQTFDADIYRWGDPVEVYDHGFPGCTAQGDLASYGAYVLDLHCYPGERADGVYPPFSNQGPQPAHHVVDLVSADGVTWSTPVRGARPLGIADPGSDEVADLVAVPQARRTTLVSPDGVTTVRGTVGGSCDVVHPVPDPDLPDGLGAVRIHTTRGATWPDVLQQWDGDRWRVIQRDLPVPSAGECRRVFSDVYETRTTYYLTGLPRQAAVQVEPRDGSWRVVRARGY